MFLAGTLFTFACSSNTKFVSFDAADERADIDAWLGEWTSANVTLTLCRDPTTMYCRSITYAPCHEVTGDGTQASLEYEDPRSRGCGDCRPPFCVSYEIGMRANGTLQVDGKSVAVAGAIRSLDSSTVRTGFLKLDGADGIVGQLSKTDVSRLALRWDRAPTFASDASADNSDATLDAPEASDGSSEAGVIDSGAVLVGGPPIEGWALVKRRPASAVCP